MTEEKKGRPEWTPKITVLVTEEQYYALQELIPWGLKSHIFQRIVDDLVTVLKSPVRTTFIAAMLSKKVHLSDFNKEAEDATQRLKEKHNRIK